jgi:predicted amidohydrolase
MLSKIGFFHFGIGHSDPVGSLRSALVKARAAHDIRDSLIVLPEAINIRKFYRDSGPCDFSREIIFELQEVSKDFETTFVAGLIISSAGAQQPPSSAYLVHHSRYVLMCYKKSDDKSGNYSCCVDNCDINNPLQQGDRSIAAVICMDLQDTPRCRSLLTGPSGEHALYKLLCIPACMTADWFNCGTLGYQAGKGILGQQASSPIVVLANSDPIGCKSFITDSDGTIAHAYGGVSNRIVLAAL